MDIQDKAEDMQLPTQCGVCYLVYDAAVDDSCPYCGSDEIVGDR